MHSCSLFISTGYFRKNFTGGLGTSKFYYRTSDRSSPPWSHITGWWHREYWCCYYTHLISVIGYGNIYIRFILSIGRSTNLFINYAQAKMFVENVLIPTLYHSKLFKVKCIKVNFIWCDGSIRTFTHHVVRAMAG